MSDCYKCPFSTCKPTPLRDSRARIVFVMDFPDHVGLYEQDPSKGHLVKRLMATLGRLGITSYDFAYTLRCRPKDRATSTDIHEAMNACKSRSRIHANLIVTLGKLSVQHILGEAHPEHVIGELQSDNVYPLWDLYNVYTAQPYLQPLFDIFLRRAWEYATGTHTEWVWPAIHTELDSKAISLLEAINTQAGPVSFDIETIPGKNIITCVGLSTLTHTVSIPWDSYDTNKWGTVLGIDVLGALGNRAKSLVSDILSTHTVITQNGSYDAAEFYKRGIIFENGFDVMLAHAIVYPNLKHGLEWVTLQYYPVPRWKRAFKSYSDEKGSDRWEHADPRVLRAYNAHDAIAQFLCWQKLDSELDTIYRGRELYESLLANSKLASKATRYGISVSRKRLNEHREEITKRLHEPLQLLEDTAKACGAKHFNPLSSKSLAFLFFDVLKVRPQRRSEKTGKPSLDDMMLTQLATSNDYSGQVQTLARLVLRVRMYSKLLSTYVNGLDDKLEHLSDEAGIFHPDFKVHGALTGRWGSYMHTIPKPRKEGGKVVAPGIRDVFVSRPGRYIIEADFSQQELRGIALLSGNKPWLDAYNSGQDLHGITAEALFGTREKQFRDLAKAFNFASNYCTADLDQAAKGIWSVLRTDFPGLELWTVSQMIRRKYKANPAIAAWRAEELAKARACDYSEEPFSGRRRYYHGQVNETEVYNFPIQAGGAYLMNNALRALESYLDWESCAMLTPWHDAIYLESSNPVEDAHKLVEVMTQTLEWDGNRMTFTVDCSVGQDFANKTPLVDFEKTHGR